MTTVTVAGLSKRYGAVTAVDDVTFELAEGRVTAFLGPNGAGKTTTLRLVLGLARPSSGRALVGGVPYARLRQPRRVVGAVLENTAAHPGRRGRDHLRVLAGAAGADDARVDELLDRVGLSPADARRRVGGYSLGMRQRLGIAGALLGDPEVLILDEPANGLDPGGMAWLRGLLRDVAAQGRTVVLSSHVLSEVAQTADDVVVLHRGVLRYSGPLGALAGDESLEAAFLRLTEAVPA
jgi:ABC-2 type transport system ATP-binding protein